MFNKKRKKSMYIHISCNNKWGSFEEDYPIFEQTVLDLSSIDGVKISPIYRHTFHDSSSGYIDVTYYCKASYPEEAYEKIKNILNKHPVIHFSTEKPKLLSCIGPGYTC